MLNTTIPIFAVILIGFLFAKTQNVSKDAEKLMSNFVLYVSLPALLFLAIAQADATDLTQWGFITAVLVGIGASYSLGLLWASYRGISAPSSSHLGMASCYGTVGYMGVPILLTAFGTQAAVPAAIATILHNVPTIMTVIVTRDICEQRQLGNLSLVRSIAMALKTTLKDPLTLAVMAGILFSVTAVPLPAMLINFADFLGAAAGATALFALGIGLGRIDINALIVSRHLKKTLPLVGFKTLIQPIATFIVLMGLAFGQAIDIWHITAVVLAAQPIGAGVFLFATRYDDFVEETSIAIVISLVVTFVSLSILLAYYSMYLL